MNRVLDVAGPQVLLHFQEGPDGFHYHHRVLLCRAGAGGVWVTLTTDLELSVHDRKQCPHRVVSRGEKLSSDLVGLSYMYIFDPIAKAELEEHRRRARKQARILADGGDPTEALEVRRLIAGPAVSRIGEVVPSDTIADDGRVRELGPLGVAEIDGEVVWCEKVAAGEPQESWSTTTRRSRGPVRTWRQSCAVSLCRSHTGTPSATAGPRDLGAGSLRRVVARMRGYRRLGTGPRLRRFRRRERQFLQLLRPGARVVVRAEAWLHL